MFEVLTVPQNITLVKTVFKEKIRVNEARCGGMQL